MLSVSKKEECPEYVECIPFPHSETINNRNVDRRTGIFVINPKPSKLSLLQITFTQRGKKKALEKMMLWDADLYVFFMVQAISAVVVTR